MSKYNYNFYDVIVIGTSPISILNVISKYRNKKILILDKNKSLGGNWSVSEIFGFKNVETGPHYIKIRNKEELLFSHLDIEIEKNIFKPVYITKNIFFKLSDRRLIEIYKKYVSEKKISWKIKLVLKFIFFLIKTIFSKHKTNYIYPKYGCVNLLNKLTKLLHKLNVNLKFNTNILEIISNDEQTRLITNNGIFFTKKCLLPSGYQNIKIISNQKVIRDVYLSCNKNNQVHLLINEKPSRKPFYYKPINNEFMAINDLSHYSELKILKNQNRRILSIRLSENTKTEDLKKLENDILRFLKKTKIIKTSSSILNFKLTKLPNKVRREKEIMELNKKTNKNIEFFYSFDLSTAINMLSDEFITLRKY